MQASQPELKIPASYARYRLKGTSAIALFFNAFLAPLRVVFTLLRRPALWSGSLKAISVNFFILLVMVLLAFFFADNVAGWIWERPGSGGLRWLWHLFELVIGLLLLMFGFLVALLLMAPVASPFLQEISRHVEEDWLGELATPAMKWTTLIPKLPSLVGIALKRLAKLVFISLPVMAVALIPLVGPLLAVVLEFTVTGIFLAVNFMDFPLERRGYSRRDTAVLIKRAFPAFLGLGLALALMLLIPFAQFLVVPIGIQAGTLVYMCLEVAGCTPKGAPETGVSGAGARITSPNPD